jgi:chemotaxis receptor (MCP) glutamine deamidase CheD
MGVSDPKAYAEALVEILAEVFPKMGADMSGIEMDITGGDNGAL